MAQLQVKCKRDVTSRTQPDKMKKSHSLTTKCAALIKEQRGRVYLLRRCATMLLCWYIHGDD